MVQTNEHVTSCRVQMQTIVFHRGGFCFAMDGSNRCESTREFTFTERRAATVSCAKSARCSVQILLTIENTRSESALLCHKRRNVFISFEIVEYL